MIAPVRATSLRIAPLDAHGVPGIWTVAGTVGPVAVMPLFEETAEAYRDWNGLDRAVTITVAFRPTREMLRLLLGPRWAWDRRRRMAVTRRKQLARRGRS